MSNFKVGDFVEVVKPSIYSGNPIGYKGFITAIEFSSLADFGPCECHEIDNNWFEHETGLRLIDTTQEHSSRTIKNLRVLRELARMPITIETLEPQKQEA